MAMRIPKKPKTHASRDDKEFERLYRTIPAGGVRGKSKLTVALEGKPPLKSRIKKWSKRLLLVLLAIVLLAGLWVGGKFLINEVKIFGWRGLVDSLKTTKLRGEDGGRVNILLAGNSADDPGHGGAELTDSIMLVSLNVKDKTGFILSIPRDLYVDIPGYGYAKINEAYQDGKRDNFSESGYAAGGMGLLEKTVSEHFGVGIQYCALVNYTALEQSVSAVDGIDVDIQSSDPRGLYDPSPDLKTRLPLVKLPNGVVHLDGRAALNLARARGDSWRSYGYINSDFTRTENQRKILLALKDKAGSMSTLSNPVKLGQLLDAMGNNVQTDLKASEVRRLYDLSKQIPSNKVQSVSLNSADGKNLLESTYYHSQSVLVPAAGLDDFSQIKAFLDSLLAVSTNSASSPSGGATKPGQ
ncbi:MAG TPA: LCP family protein [Candidatus Saccharimonadales bacterium]